MQLRHLVDLLAGRLREQEAVDERNEADLTEEAADDYLRDRNARLTSAQRLARRVARKCHDNQVDRQRQNYFDQHFRSQFHALMAEMEQRSAQKPDPKEAFEIAADEGLSGVHSLTRLANIVEAQAARMPSD